jgi:hypothetical protein
VDFKRNFPNCKKLSFLRKDGDVTRVDAFPTLAIPPVFSRGDTPDRSRCDLPPIFSPGIMRLSPVSVRPACLSR